MGYSIRENVRAAMQEAEERGGPEGEDYVDLMEDIAADATRRALNARIAIDREGLRVSAEDMLAAFAKITGRAS